MCHPSKDSKFCIQELQSLLYMSIISFRKAIWKFVLVTVLVTDERGGFIFIHCTGEGDFYCNSEFVLLFSFSPFLFFCA